jgi:ribose 5-phosphate isomerase RpiB
LFLGIFLPQEAQTTDVSRPLINFYFIDKARLIILYGDKVSGLFMKVYVAGDNRGQAVKLSNSINSAGNTAIMSENVSSDCRSLVDDILSQRSGSFDLVVAISKQPIETSIEANRNTSLRAAVCRNQKEADMAGKAHANVMVLEGDAIDDEIADDIVNAWFKATGQDSVAMSTSAPTKQKQGASAQKSTLSFANEKSNQKKRKNAVREEEPLEEDKEGEEKQEAEQESEQQDEEPPKGKGIIDQLKYTFGIE